MPINFVPNQTRTPGSQVRTYFSIERLYDGSCHSCYSISFLLLQSFFTRGPAPRMANHRNQVVNMQPNNVGQQIFSQHVSFISLDYFYKGIWLE
jgi:hypothetical protein